jgi:pimeloyl-ACP methyl ester carboxylesterase
MSLPESALKKIRRVGKMLNALSAVSPALAGRAAFRIFCTPRRLPLRDHDRAFLATAEQGTIHVDRKAVRTYTWPAAQPGARTVLFLHGWESNSGRWHKYVKAAREAGFRVQAFDAPANGHSEGSLLNVLVFARALKVFLEKYGTPHAVVGHSMGGASAVMSMTLSGAPRPEKLILMGVFAESTRVIGDFGQMLALKDAVIQSVHREIERRSGQPIEEYSVRKKAALLHDVRGLVLHDRDDEVAPVTEGRAIAESWGCPFVETAGLGHRMQDKSVVEAVLAFLRQ